MTVESQGVPGGGGRALGLGDSQGALDSLERAYELRSPNMVFLLIEPFFEEIRDDSRYRSLLVDLNLAS